MSEGAANLASAISGADGAAVLALRVQPGAKRSQLMGLHGDRLRVAVASPPVDGKANRALVIWIAKLLGLRRSEVALISGAASRDKRVCCDASRSEIEAALTRALI